MKAKPSIMLKIVVAICVAIIPLLAMSQPAGADGYGIVTEISGKVVIKRDGKKIKADVGMNLLGGDVIMLQKKDRLVLVSYERCEEWKLAGKDRIVIDSEQGPVSKKRELKPGGELPVCYSAEEFKDEQPRVIGGFVLRGKSRDPVADLRKAFRKGKASNAVLMMLIMHDLKNGHVEKARPYYEELKRRVPCSRFVQSVSPRFEKKK